MTNGNLHIAVLSTMYYPDMGAPSACIDKYIKELKNIYNFHIITRTDETDFIKSEQNDVRYINGRMHKVRLWCNNRIKNNKYILFSKIILLCINIIKLIQTQFAFPTAQNWETGAYFKELEKLHKEHPIGTVIAVSNTIFTQLAALKFKQKYPDVKWIAFITDPYSENYIYYKYKLFKKFWKSLNLKKELKIYSNCDSILLTHEMFKYVSKTFLIGKTKINKIEYALQNHHYNNGDNFESQVKHFKCRLIYAGMFYKEIRNPEFALSILSKLEEAEVDLYVGEGECEDIIRKYGTTNIKRNFFVDHNQYINMINKYYDILVNIGNKASLQAPSKMLELLSTGKPIINFYHSKDSQYDMIEKYPLGMNIGKEEVDAIRKVSEFCKAMKGKSIPFKEVSKLFPENNLEYQINIMKKLIEA